MTISAISGLGTNQLNGNSMMAQFKKNFDDLGSALQSGNVTDAKKALTQLQQNAPPQGKDSNNPMSSDLQTLSKAIENGDLSTAQQTYAKIQSNISKAQAGGTPGGAAQPKPQGDTVNLSSSSGKPSPSGSGSKPSSSSTSSLTSSATSSKYYDKMDANKDGKVSAKEELDYKAKHPEESASDKGKTAESSETKESTQESEGVETYV